MICIHVYVQEISLMHSHVFKEQSVGKNELLCIKQGKSIEHFAFIFT